MCRQVLWWQADRLPTMEEMQSLALTDLDGLLVGGSKDAVGIARWQERHAQQADELPAISFEVVRFQQRWLAFTAGDQYVVKFLEP